MKIRFIFALLVCLGLPFIACAEVYKCKNADGKVTYSDQECLGSATARTPPNLVSNPPTLPPVKREERTVQAGQKNEPKPSTFYPRSSMEPDPPMSQQEKDKWRAFAKDMDKKYAAHLTELTQSCKRGDTKACTDRACHSLDQWRGLAEDFIYCAKARGLPHGSYWVITEGRPDTDPQSDKHLLEAALTPRLKEGRHETRHKLDLMCFRKNRTRTDVTMTDPPLVDRHQIDQILYVEKGAKGPLLRLTFSENGDRAYGTKTMPEHKTLEELIDKTCEK